MVAYEIWLGIGQQIYRGFSHLSGGYWPILLRPMVWELCFPKFDDMLLKFLFRAGWSELPTLEFGHISKGKLTEHQTQRRNGSTFHQSNRDNNKTLHKPQRQKLTPIYTIDKICFRPTMILKIPIIWNWCRFRKTNNPKVVNNLETFLEGTNTASYNQRFKSCDFCKLGGVAEIYFWTEQDIWTNSEFESTFNEKLEEPWIQGS
jgi:hypothetical protein